MGGHVWVGRALIAVSATCAWTVWPASAGATVATKAPRAVTPTSTGSLTSGLSRSAFSIKGSGATLDLEYCGNGSVDVQNAAVRTLVVVVHGDDRNACDYASYVVDAARRAGRLGSTLVVAPHFYADSDAVPPGTLYWSDGGWKTGDQSLRSRRSGAWTIGSYEALDLLIGGTADRTRFPNLSRIVVAGHSAGGQFTNRYAAGTRLTAAAIPGVTRRFVVANPSSYLYFDPKRFSGSVLRNLTRAEVSACPGYDDYKYGLQGRNRFMAALDAATLRERYAASDVTYLLGARDTDPAGASLDKTCAAKWQGSQRLERGTRYYEHLGVALGPSVYRHQHKVVVPGVGHNGHSMLASAAGRAALFQ